VNESVAEVLSIAETARFLTAPGLVVPVAVATVSVALPLLPSLVAVIWEVPTATAVTRPALETVATPVLAELQTTARPDKTLLAESRMVALACVVCPGFRLDDTRETLTEETGATSAVPSPVTVIVALPDLPLRAAVMTAVPSATPVTSPLGETVATALSLELQVTVRLGSLRPRQSRNVAVAVVVSPTAIELLPNDTVTEAIRVASAERSSVLSPFVPVRLSLLQENMLNAARAVPTPRDSVRFMS